MNLAVAMQMLPPFPLIKPTFPYGIGITRGFYRHLVKGYRRFDPFAKFSLVIRPRLFLSVSVILKASLRMVFVVLRFYKSMF